MHKKFLKKLSTPVLTILLLSATSIWSISAQAQEPFIGEIKMFGGNFAPRGYAFTSGQLLPISQNSALFSILGTTYGGDGRTTFGLPDLRGRVPMHAGNGPGLSNRTLGQKGGLENVTLTTQNLPSHTHAATATSTSTQNAYSGNGDVNSPAGNVLANDGNDRIYSNTAPDVSMSASSITTNTSVTINNTGNGIAHENMQPYLVVNFIIALQGVFPSRN